MSRPPTLIHALPEHLINQIAAGEVIERPVSVVKELVENSLDAGATRIEVDVVGGGIDGITVSDNGSGIASHEIGAAVQRHWTSKITTADDLDAISTLGFRGEALASISAVAELVMTTRTASDAHAWRVSCVPGEPPAPPQPAQGRRGTRVEVRGLFHRIPARKRFLKQPRTEYLHIFRLLRQLAFARADVAFRLSHGDARGLNVSPAGFDSSAPRWRTLFGKQFCAAAHAVEASLEGVHMRGWVGGPELATNLADTQFLVVNGRVIRDQQLQHAIRLAYQESIAEGRFPAYALAIDIDPRTLDVNVHPGKIEVRFVDVRSLHDMLHAVVRQALATAVDGNAPNHGSTDAVGQRVHTTTALGETRHAYHAGTARVGSPHQRAATPGRALARVAQFVLYARADTVAVLDLERAWHSILTRRFAVQGRPLTRPLLLPQRVPATCTRVLAARAKLAALGFEFDDLGAAGMMLRALPGVLPALEPGALLDRLEAALRNAVPVAEAGVAAAAQSLAHDDTATTASSALDALSAAAAAAGIDLETLSATLDASALHEVSRRGRS